MIVSTEYRLPDTDTWHRLTPESGSVLICLFGLLLCLTVGEAIGSCQALPRDGLSGDLVVNVSTFPKPQFMACNTGTQTKRPRSFSADNGLRVQQSGCSRRTGFDRLPRNDKQSKNDRPSSDSLGPCEVAGGPYWRLTGILCIVAGLAVVAFGDRSRLHLSCALFAMLLGGFCILGHTNDCGEKNSDEKGNYILNSLTGQIGGRNGQSDS